MTGDVVTQRDKLLPPEINNGNSVEELADAYISKVVLFKRAKIYGLQVVDEKGVKNYTCLSVFVQKVRMGR